ncbi:MAG: protein phosphatase 2C domain-containing protein [Pseudomonadota bacterium]
MPEAAFSLAQVSGIGGRTSNEDALGHVQRGAVACFVVSDGAGGHEGGEVASAITVQAVLATIDAPFSEDLLRAAIGQASTSVASAKTDNGALAAMSATVAAVLLDTHLGLVCWAHLGDTRVHLFRSRQLAAMTKDHSLVQQFVDAGLATDADTRNHPKRNLLYAAIGAEGDTHATIQSTLALQAGDAILICTDGLWEWVTEDAMAQALAKATSVDDWLATMCAAADTASGASGKARDNFTAMALWIVQP